ncbi:hypothetical protein ACFOPQ_19755 [Deinococcus antarcticus]|uniref:Uncharacterized protein n=1 Tax=Deinococcus antarcticus TaxID=1298767 RepID=A0ABV8AFL0_9DEIO
MKKNIALMALTGILTLASCSQPGAGTDTDTNKPSVTFGSQTGVVAGSTVTLTGSVSDDKGVKSVSLDSANGGPICTPVVNGSTWSCTVTAPSPSASTTYNYVVTATDTSNNTQTATGSVQVNAAETGGPQQGAPVINISSPAQGETFKDPTTILVTGNVESKGALKELTVNGVAVPVNAGLNNAINLVLPVGTVAAGNYNIVVTATDVNNKTSTLTRTVTIARTAATTGTLVVGPSLGNNGREAALLPGGGRDLAQSGTDASGPVSDVYTYVKGIIDVTATAPAGASRLEVYVAATPDGPAIDNLIDTSNPTGPVTVKYDTRRRGNLEAQPLYIVTRVNNTSVSFKRIVVDNTAPDPADVEFTGKNIRKNYGSNSLNYARGAITLSTTNTDLRDKPNGTSAGVRLMPSGFDSVSYYFVPAPYELTAGGVTPKRTAVTNEIDNASTATQKLAAVKKNARDQKDVTASGNNDDFSAEFNSVGSKLTDGAYRIYSIVRDQLGNEALNPQYQTVIFDNAAPSIKSVGLRDDSPLPFPSANPTRYISDWFVVAPTGNGDPVLADGTPGIGIDQNSQITLGSLNITAGGRFDSNLLADGTYSVNVSGLKDILGNATDQSNGAQIIVDNSDPAINFNGLDNSTTVTSGDEVTAQTTVSDRFSGIYRTFMFWNDYTDAGATRNRGAGYIAAPVEFYNNQVFTPAQTAEVLGPISNSARWNAVYPNATASGNQMMWLQGMAIDNAGNASLVRREIMVRPKSSAYSAPTLGQFDAYRRDMTPAFTATPLVTPGNLALRGADGTMTGFGIEGKGTVGGFEPGGDLYASPVDAEVDARIQLRVPGSNLSVANSNGGEKISTVDMYGQLNAALWQRIVNYQTGNGAAGSDVDPTLSYNNGLASSRGFQWTNIAAAATGPWLKLGNTSTSSEFYSADTSVNSFLSDYILLDERYVGTPKGTYSTPPISGPQATGTARPFYDTRNANQLPYFKYDAVAGILTDTAGFRASFGEAVSTNTLSRTGVVVVP